MHLAVFFYQKKNVSFLHNKQQWKCPQDNGKAPKEAKTCSLLGSIWCELLSFILWAYFLLVTWSCRVPDHGFCAFWSRVPRSGRRCCPAVLLSLPALCWRQAKMHIPSLLTFSHTTDSASLHSTLCSPVESPDFPLASGKVWHTNFFSVWDSTLPAPSIAMGPHHRVPEEGKPSVFGLLFACREAHTRQEHSKLFKMLTLQRRGKLFYWLNIHDALVYDSSRFINTWMSCCLVGGSVEGTILSLCHDLTFACAQRQRSACF